MAANNISPRMFHNEVQLSCVIGTSEEVDKMLDTGNVRECVHDWDVQTCMDDSSLEDNPKFELIGVGFLIINRRVFNNSRPSKFWRIK